MIVYRKNSIFNIFIRSAGVWIICTMLAPSLSFSAPSTSLVINEIMFNPAGSDVGLEWIELIARNDVTVNSWTLRDNDGNIYTFPATPALNLKAGEIIVVHMGRAPAGGNDTTGPVYYLYVYPNTGTPNPVEWFGNTGDDIDLRNNSGTRIDYVAYGTGAEIDPPGTGMSWTNTPDITYYTEGKSYSLIKDGIDTDTGSDWGETTPTPGLPNSAPSLTISKSQTSGSAVDRGNDAGEEFTLTVTNVGNGPAYGIQLFDNYPLNYGTASITSVQRNGSAVSYTPTDDGDTISFANLPNLLNGDTLTVKLRLKALCSASPMFVNNTAGIRYYGTPELSDVQKTGSATIDTETLAGSIYPDLIVTHKNGVPYSYSGVPEVDVGDVLRFQASIYNLNAGKLYNVDAYATWNTDGTKPNGMNYAGNLSCNGASSPATTCSYDGNKTVTINRLSSIDGNTASPSPYYGTFDLQVAACENLIVRFYVTDQCENPTWWYMETSPKVVVKNAVIDYTLPNPITIQYGTTNTINIPITNTGSGNARTFAFDTDLNTYPVTITNVAPNWTYNSADGTFAYSQIIGPGSTTTLSFDIAADAPCANRSISGQVLFEPSYTSGCGDWFYPPRKFSSLNTVNIPSVSIAKSSNPATYAYIGQSVTYTVTLTTQNAAGLSGNIVVTDNAPSSVTVTGASASAGTVDRTGNNMTWTIPAGSANGQTLTITGSILNDPCIQGTSTTNTASFSVTDNAGCVLTGSDSATLYLNLNPGGTVTQQKTVSPSPAEACNSSNLSTVTNNYGISAGVTGTWNGSIFDDDMSSGRLCYVTGSADYNFNSGGWTAVPSGSITQPGGHLRIDLSFLGAGNVENSDLTIRYQVYVCESELSGPTANFVTLSDIFLNGNDQSCATNQGHYNQFLIIPAQRANVTAGITLNSSTVEDCGEYTASITVNNPSGLTYYDLILEIPTTNYEYLGSLTRTGFDGINPTVTTPAGKVVFSFDATGSPDPLTQGGTLQFRVRNRCGLGKDISVTGTAKTRSESGALPTACCAGTCGGTTINLSGNYSPVFENKGDLVMTVTPEKYPVNTASLSWKIYVTNRGSGTAYNVEVKDVLGPNLEYVSSTINGVPAAPTVTTRGVPSDTQTITWTVGDIPMKEMRIIEVFVDGTGYSCNSFYTTSQITTTWGCGSPFGVCQTLTGAGPANFEYPEASATVGTIVGTATICANTQIKIRYKNTGISDIYYSELIQDFQQSGMTVISGTAQFSSDDITYAPIADPIIGVNAYGGQTLTWKGYGSGTGYVSQLETVGKGKTVYIRFNATTNCDLAVHPDIKASGSFQKPCQKGTDPSIPSNRTSVSESVKIIPYEKASLTATVMLRNATTNPGGAFTNGNVYAAHNDEVEYRVVIRNTSASAVAQNVTLQDILPENLTFIGITTDTSATLPSPGCTLESGGVTGGAYLNWTLQNVSPNRCQQYFIRARVNDCAAPAGNSVTVNYGCPDGGGCQFINPASGEHGTYGKLITMVSIDTAAQVDTVIPFTTCGGGLKVKVKNSGARTKLNYGAEIQPDLTENWIYDATGAMSVTSNQRGALSSPANYLLDTTDPRRPKWSIDYLATDEEVTVTFYVKTGGAACDTDLGADPICPGSPSIDVAINIYDSCGTLNENPKTLTVSNICPDLDITTFSVSPSNPLVNENGTVTFNLRIRNNGNVQAQNNELVLYLGDAYTVDTASHGGLIDNSINPRTVTWSRTVIGNLNPSSYWPSSNITVTVTVKSGSLQAWAEVSGWCKDFGGADGCRHSYDRTYSPRVAAINHSKEVVKVNEPGGITNPTNTEANASLGNAVYFDIKLKLLGEGTYTNFLIDDRLAASGTENRFEFVSSNFFLDEHDDSTFVRFTGASPTYVTDGFLYLRYVQQNTAPMPRNRFYLDNDTNTGSTTFTVGPGEAPKFVTLRVAARVKAPAVSGDTLINQSIVNFSYDPDGSASNYYASGNYNNTTSYPTLLITNTITIIEPHISVTKCYPSWGTSDNICGAAIYDNVHPKEVFVGETVPFTMIFKNSGTSPAFDLVITDMIPFGMRKSSPVITQVFIDTNSDNTYNGSDRLLTSPSGYSYTWNPGTGAFIISLEDGNYGDSNTNCIIPNEQLIIQYELTVDHDIGPGITMENSVTASYSSIRGVPPNTIMNPDVLPDANEKTYSTGPVTTRLTSGTAEITKAGTLDGIAAVEGDEIVYTLTFPNPTLKNYMYGDDDDNDPHGTPEFSDTLPDGLEITHASVSVTATKACEVYGTVTVPQYLAKAPLSGICAVVDDRVFYTNISIPTGGARNRKVDIDFNKLYPGDYLVVTIKAKIRPTFDDNTTIPHGHQFINQGVLRVWSAPTGQLREAFDYYSNQIVTTYQKLLSITPDRSGQTTPNSWVVYEHTVNNLTSRAEAVCFSIASLNGWNWFITDQSGNILTDGAVRNSLTIPANDSVKIFIKYFVPSDVPIGTVEGTTILLNRYAGSCQIADIYDFVIDTTTIQHVSMKLSKLVRKCLKTDINACDPFVEKNQADPCDYLEYQITFFNHSANEIRNLSINDVIPDHTDFTDDAYGAGQDVFVRKPDGTEFYKSVMVTSETLKVELSSDIPSLLPGESGWIRYKVRVEGVCTP